MEIPDLKAEFEATIRHLKRQISASEKQIAEMQATRDALSTELKVKEETLRALGAGNDNVLEQIHFCDESIEALCGDLMLATEVGKRMWVLDKIDVKRELKRNLEDLLIVLREE